MNINRAKALAGLPRHARVTGRDGAELALKALKPLIVQARKIGDDLQAAKLSEAKEVFRKRLVRHNRCGVCGKPISASATRCRLCLKPAALPFPGHILPNRSLVPRRSGGIRNTMFPKGGLFAQLGWYTLPVQRVVARWANRRDMGTITKAFEMAALPIVFGITIRLSLAPETWQLFYELGAALATLYNDRTIPESWLLKQPHMTVNGCSPSWDDALAKIISEGGPRFTVHQLKSAAKRMHLLCPTAKAMSHFRAELKRAEEFRREELERLCVSKSPLR